MLQQMRYFVAVVQNHSFTKAAAECNIAQSSISQQIKDLSNTLGVELVKRKGRSFEITKAGNHFYQECQSILDQVDKLVEDTRTIEKEDTEEYVLRIGYLRKFGSKEFLRAVAQFSKEYPQVRVKIHSGSYSDLFDLIRDSKIDLNFSDQRHAFSNVYENLYLTDTDYMVVMSPDKFVDHDVIDTQELKDTPCILVVGADEFASEQEYYRNILGIKSPFRSAATFGEAQMLAASGQGFIVVNSRTAGLVDQEINRVVKLVDNGRDLNQRYFAYWKKSNSGYYIETFAQILKSQFN
ncbi:MULTISPECIES: LysR family transcriptional regulator [Companilactobacillus]|uniref:LysR family transcriptional regulator n=1 Tax=Companilactobacillus heilongjiangensis TaxID=1074467 RepID=A0A0K2LCR7_9LACO|nr:LysR family transcriptional regulator [Companilactobacillus heilongjiangensis]ALB29091.1 LysR family transcriptional regulator [Companilactobacillus heilongjiangensis]